MQRWIVCVAIGAVLLLLTWPILSVSIDKAVSHDLEWSEWCLAVFHLLTADGTSVLMTLMLLVGAAIFLFGVLAGILDGVRWIRSAK